MNMRNFRFLCLLCAAVAAVSCERAVIKGAFTDAAPASHVITVRIPQGQDLKTIDSIAIDKSGKFSYRAKVKKGQPEFFYLYSGDRKLSSLVLSCGDRVKVECDTLGAWQVEGSQDCAMLRENELDLAAQMASGELTYRQFMDYYRKMVRFVLANSHSMTVVPVLYSKLWDTPLFARDADAVIMSNVADSLETVYPKSRYVRQLRVDSKKRMDQLYVGSMVSNAPASSFPELEFPDITGERRKLSDSVKGKTLLVFWDCTDPSSADLNLAVLLPYYKKTGTAIYQVNVGMSKNAWAAMMKAQNLPWTNVCDIYGRSIASYGIDALPCAFILDDKSLSRVSLNSL